MMLWGSFIEIKGRQLFHPGQFIPLGQLNRGRWWWKVIAMKKTQHLLATKPEIKPYWVRINFPPPFSHCLGANMEGTENIKESLHLLNSGAHCTKGDHWSASSTQPLKPVTDFAHHEKVCENHADKFSHVLAGQAQSLSEFGQFLH